MSPSFENSPHAPRRHARLAVLAAAVLSSASLLAQDTLTVELRDAEGEVVGEATITPLEEGVLIDATLSGIDAGTHGFHLHESGDCDASTGFESAGGHIAGDREHGFLVPGGPHPGDMPNIHVPDSGELRVEVVNRRVSLGESGDGGLLDADGSALMVHSGADDYESQPSGAAGERIACGEIGGG